MNVGATDVNVDDERATRDALDAARLDFNDMCRMTEFFEVPGSYSDAARELWWEVYNREFDRLESELSAKLADVKLEGE